jgi:gamma-glutamylaminecyclotransferase
VSVLVFVFGTLKEGFPNHHINGGRRLAGTFSTAVPYPLYLVGERRSPWMLDDPMHGSQVRGQVFEVDEAALRQMDVLERVDQPDGYRRKRIGVLCDEDATPLDVFVYLKDAVHFLAHSEDAIGPLSEYTAAHAALYRPRT